MPVDYHIRPATIADADALVHHRIGMFTDMGTPIDAAALASAFRRWLPGAIESGLYRAWVVEADGQIVSGGGITVLPWPPGPVNLDDRLAVVYNVYTEPAHRTQGLARLVMDTIHGWCREAGIHTVALAASQAGRPLYESMGYQIPPNPMMFLALSRRP